MKKTGMMIMMGIVLMAMGSAFGEVTMRPSRAEEAALVGANYSMELSFVDLTAATADIAQTNTFTVTGPCVISWQGAILESDLDDQLGTATTNDVSWTLKLGSTTLVNAAKVSVDQTTTTRRWYPGSLSSGSVTIAATNTATAVTLTASTYAVIASGATTTVTSILTPSGGSALSDMKAGKIKAYFRRW